MANKSFYYPGVEKMYLFQRDGSENNPFLPLTQTSKVKYARVDLSEIPDFERKVTVISSDGTSLIEVFTTDLSENEYLVDYSKGFVRFHPSQESNTFEISYLGMGRVNIPANRITIDTDESNEAELSIQELLDAQGNIGTRLDSAKNDMQNVESLIVENQVVKQTEYEAFKTKLQAPKEFSWVSTTDQDTFIIDMGNFTNKSLMNLSIGTVPQDSNVYNLVDSKTIKLVYPLPAGIKVTVKWTEI